MVSYRSLLFAVAGIVSLAQTVGATPFITVGEATNALADWGITLKDANDDNTVATDWSAFDPTNPNPNDPTPSPVSGTRTLGNGFKYNFVLEDNYDYKQNVGDVLGPNQGGQDYDAEFMGVGRDANRLVIAIATGQRPDNGFDNFSPGDIRIDTFSPTLGIRTFGVEVGGGKGGLTDTGVVRNNPTGPDTSIEGSTYKLKTNGHTDGWLSSTGSNYGNIDGTVNLDPNPDDKIRANALQVAGSIWTGGAWILDPINNPAILTAAQLQTRVKIDGVVQQVATLMGEADYYYSRNAYDGPENDLPAKPGQHAIIELAIDLSLFGTDTIISTISWAPACGNDVLVISNPDLQVNVPEPTSMLLTGFGALGFIGYRRRLKTKAA
jgi:hypothetical protein